MSVADITETRPKLRWSSTRSCPRRARYEAEGAPARPWSPDEQWIFARGHALEDAYEKVVVASSGLKYVREKKVVWAGGVGHEDFFFPDTGVVTECLSSENPTDAMIDAKIMQLAGYLTFDDEAGDVGLLVILRSSRAPETIPFTLTAAWRERVEELTAAALSPSVPPRVCSRPQDARGKFCPFAEHCFAGWEAPPLNLIDDADARDLATRFYDVKQRERAVKEQLGVVESERKEIEQRLLDVVPVGKHQVGHLEVTRTQINRGPTVDLKRAELAGFPVDTLSDFLKPGASYSTFRVDRLPDVAADYGEVPF